MIIRWLAGLALAATLLATGLPAQAQTEPDYQTMSVEELIAAAPELHPAALYILAARLMGAGDGYAAAQWMYAGQLRYRFLLATQGDDQPYSDDRILFSALSESVGRPINEYIGGDVDEWLAVIAWALDWDAKTDNLFLSKTEHAAALQEVRAGLAALRADIESQRDDIPRIREENGLENR